MTDPHPPAWRAMQIGPGALDPLMVRPVGVAPIRQGSIAPAGYRPQSGYPGPAHAMNFQPGYLASPMPPPLTGSVGPKSRWRRLRDGKNFGTIVIGVIISVILTAVIWATAVVGNDEVSVGDCLTIGALLPSEVGCDTTEAEFRVISRYDDTTDYSRCASDEPDAGLAVGNAVLCVNYVARVGDCLYADEGSNVGKEPCSSQLDGLYQVVEIVTNSLDSGRCPQETDKVVLHRSELEVICLIENP